MAEELREAQQRQELKQEYFTPFEWKKMLRIMKDPQAARKWMELSMGARRLKRLYRSFLGR